MELEILVWDGTTIVDIYENMQHQVLKTKDDKYRTRIGFSGINLNFKNNSDYEILYFNKINFVVIFEKNMPQDFVIEHSD